LIKKRSTFFIASELRFTNDMRSGGSLTSGVEVNLLQFVHSPLMYDMDQCIWRITTAFDPVTCHRKWNSFRANALNISTFHGPKFQGGLEQFFFLLKAIAILNFCGTEAENIFLAKQSKCYGLIISKNIRV